MGVAVSSSHIVSDAPCSSYSSLVPACDPSHRRQSSTNFSNVSPSHGLQFFTDCRSVGPSHGVQSFRNRLLQCGVFHGVTSPASKAGRCGLISPRGHRSWQEPAPVWPPHGVTASFGHPPAPVCGPQWAAGGDLLHHGPPWAAGEQSASPGSSARAAGESLLWCLEHLLPSFCTDLGVCRVVSLAYSHSSLQLQLLLLRVFFPLNMLSRMCYHRPWWARPWPAVGLSWSSTGHRGSF